MPFVNPAVQEMFDSERRLVLVTAHRRESWGDGLQRHRRGRRAARRRRTRRSPSCCRCIPNPRVRSTLRPLLDDAPNVLLCEPVSYGEFARLLARCDFAITDSGGIQEEAPALGKPVLVTRDVTERSEGVDAGTLALVGTDADRIFSVASALLTDPWRTRRWRTRPIPTATDSPPTRIVAALEYLHCGRRRAGPVRLEPRPPRRARRRRAWWPARSRSLPAFRCPSPCRSARRREPARRRGTGVSVRRACRGSRRPS